MRKSLFVTVTALVGLASLSGLSGCIEGHLIPPFNPFGPGGVGANSFATGKMVNGVGMSGKIEPSLVLLRDLVFKNLDKNSNQQLSAAEIPATLDFGTYDSDKSGELSLAEFSKASEEFLSANVPVSESQLKSSISSGWNRLENNFDGRVDARELKASVLGSNSADATCNSYSSSLTDLFNPGQPPRPMRIANQCSGGYPGQGTYPANPVNPVSADAAPEVTPSYPQTTARPDNGKSRAFSAEDWASLEKLVDEEVQRFLDGADTDKDGVIMFKEFETEHLRLYVATAPDQLARSSFMVMQTKSQLDEMMSLVEASR